MGKYAYPLLRFHTTAGRGAGRYAQRIAVDESAAAPRLPNGKPREASLAVAWPFGGPHELERATPDTYQADYRPRTSDCSVNLQIAGRHRSIVI